MLKYVGIARKLPDDLKVMVAVSHALLSAVAQNATSLNTLLAIPPRVVFVHDGRLLLFNHVLDVFLAV